MGTRHEICVTAVADIREHLAPLLGHKPSQITPGRITAIRNDRGWGPRRVERFDCSTRNQHRRTGQSMVVSDDFRCRECGSDKGAYQA